MPHHPASQQEDGFQFFPRTPKLLTSPPPLYLPQSFRAFCILSICCGSLDPFPNPPPFSFQEQGRVPQGEGGWSRRKQSRQPHGNRSREPSSPRGWAGRKPEGTVSVHTPSCPSWARLHAQTTLHCMDRAVSPVSTLPSNFLSNSLGTPEPQPTQYDGQPMLSHHLGKM